MAPIFDPPIRATSLAIPAIKVVCDDLVLRDLLLKLRQQMPAFRA
jgi:hypothetical protein